MGLAQYHKKRNFARTPEPKGDARVAVGSRFVVQKHAASHLHYDFRLELEGVLKSWAVPKGPSLDPSVKTLAVHVEDHPVDYGSFEGVIPQGEYGGGTVMLWDQGTWEPEGSASKMYRDGKLKFTLHGEKLKGSWALVRMGGRAGENGRNWLLIKHKDSAARSTKKYDVLKSEDRSVSSGRSMKEIAADADNVWSSNRPATSKLKRKKPAAASSNGKTQRPKRTTSKTKLDPSYLSGAKKAKQPTELIPQLTTLVKEPPEGDQWLHELKLDGYRILAFLENGHCRLITRKNNDWTERLQMIAREVEKLPVRNAILDGEAVVLEPDGRTDFQALQNLMSSGREDRLVFFAFDLPFCEDYDLRNVPLLERKQLLEQLLGPAAADEGVIRYSSHIRDQGQDVFARACRLRLEGIVSKQVDSIYESIRSRSWVKVKCVNRQEFVIGGWSDPSGARKHFGALLLGYYDDEGRLTYCGRCGTGFNHESLARLHAELVKRQIKQTSFHNPPRGADARNAHWVKPELIAEIEFAEWTDDGMLRQASFEGLREDKKPEEVTIEKPKSTNGATPSARGAQRASRRTAAKKEKSSNLVAGVRITNPDRVIFPASELTKSDLAQYYASVADWILPHVIDRPLTMVRCPRGSQEKCFYQKHLTESIPEPVVGVEVEERSGTGVYVTVKDATGLITLVQMGAIEFHPWGSRNDQLERPDRIIFDLDPDKEVGWKEIVDTAFKLRDMFEELGLACFPRTSGGKGLHVVIPIQRKTGWDEVKQFARDVALQLVKHEPDKYIANMSKAKRKGKIFVDYLRNDRGATAIASYAVRARAGAPVAAPITWDELTPRLKPDAFNVTNTPQRLAKLKKDPWDGFLTTRQTITKQMQKAVRLT